MQHTTCLGCGCLCDDIEVRVDQGRIVHLDRACALGVSWFGDGTAPSRALVRGAASTVEAALDEAAAMLRHADNTLVLLAPELSCEAQRAGVAIADALGAALDSVTSSTAMASILAAQERGRAAATLGEVRRRADLVVAWEVDLAACYPRFLERYAPDAEVLAPPIDPAGAVALLTTLTARVGRPAAPGASALENRLRSSRYVVVVADAEEHGPSGTGRASALIALVQALNGPTRAALVTLRGGGNRSGADAVMTSHTAYPAAVDFAQGYPRYRPHDGGAVTRLARGEVDAVLVLGEISRIPAHLRALLAGVPSAVIGPRASVDPFAGAGAVVDTGIAGIHDAGTALRTDDVPLPLRRVVAGPPETLATVRALGARLTKADAVGATTRRIGTRRV